MRRFGAVLVAVVLVSGLFGAGVAEAGAVSWSPCEGAPAGHPVECATLTVPADWSTGTGSVALRVSRLRATSPERRVGVLMFNPGGPGTGAAGYLMAPQYARAYFGPEVLARFDVVGVDPRGVGGSTPVSCAVPADDPSVDRFPSSAAGVRALVRSNVAFARSCDHAEQLDTASVARDLDAVRAALGERQLSFLGVSYGTMLGRAYAELFPHRLRALALDAIVDRSLPVSRLVADDAAAVQDGVEHFASWCASSSCGVDVLPALHSVLASADRGELLAGDRPVTAYQVSAGVNAHLQSPLLYPALATALRAALALDGSGLVGLGADPLGSAMYRTIVCQDFDTRAFTAQLPGLARRVQRAGPALRGYSEFWDIASGCAGWPVAAAWRPHRWPHLDLPPALLLSGAHDVATPRRWAERTRRQLPESTLLRWSEAGHSAWHLNSECATQATIAYLLTRELPTTTC
ncbi:alpha/beta hydrolase [Tenggerimyces flavus]|uniref:Alpha/beta hydrolase n=1 Tax=Tenggerimyces flavus TaxID=1708749 RepID=A0ABV7Y429_9ACTN|nr:alpha/beta hydrolase [Tenggerimyces flavus]MBM7788586.1 pimeloyl-ACP methyl ester carboxylesterase [Tenggerimyces flavus]